MTGKEVIDWINRNGMNDKKLRFQVIEDGTSGTFECFHCLHRSVIWQSDFDFADYGYEGTGIVQNLICANCGAEIEYRVPFDVEEDEDDRRTETD